MEKLVIQDLSELAPTGWSSKIQYFEEVPPEVWNFRNASYQICKNWFKSREGCFLSNEDSQHYKRIVIILKEMVMVVEEIKTKIQCDQLKKLKVFEEVRTILVEKLRIEPDRVTRVANFANDFGADSLDTVEIVMALEEAFDIEIPNKVAETLLTVQQAIDYINQKIEVTI